MSAAPRVSEAAPSMVREPRAEEFEGLVESSLPTLVSAVADREHGRLYRFVMSRVERPLLQHALALAGGNQLRAARLLGVNRNTLRKRLRSLGLLAAPATRGRPAP